MCTSRLAAIASYLGSEPPWSHGVPYTGWSTRFDVATPGAVEVTAISGLECNLLCRRPHGGCAAGNAAPWVRYESCCGVRGGTVSTCC